jgi:carbonic anhydrase
VRWFVLKTPMTISAEQLHIFETTMGDTNNRPVQKLNARLILE